MKSTRPIRIAQSMSGGGGGASWFSVALSNACLWVGYHSPFLSPPASTFMEAAEAAAASSSSSPAASVVGVFDPSAFVQKGLSLWNTGTSTAAAASATTSVSWWGWSSAGASGGSTFMFSSLLASPLSYPFFVLFLSGMMFRLVCSLPFTLYGELALNRFHQARPALVTAYKEYLYIAGHPKSISWERKVAAERLSCTRRSILKRFKTNNLKVYLPFLLASGMNVGFLLGPVVGGGLLGSFLVQHAFPSPSMSAARAASLLEASSSSSSLAVQVSALQQHIYCPSPLLMCISVSPTLASTSSSAVFMLVDPTWAIAAWCTSWNLYQHFLLRGKKGMGSKSTAVKIHGILWSRQLCRVVGLAGGGLFILPAWSLFTSFFPPVLDTSRLADASSTSSMLPATMVDSLWWSFIILPSYIAPVWLGMATTTMLKNAVMRLCGRYSKTSTPHGHKMMPQHVERKGKKNQPPRAREVVEADEGEEEELQLDTSNSHPYKLSFSGEEAEERRELWKIQKKMLEYECDIRLFRYVKHLWTPAEELEEEARKLKEKVSIARERRQHRQQQQEKVLSGSSSFSRSGSGKNGMTQEEERELGMIVEAQCMRNNIYEKRYSDVPSSSSSAPLKGKKEKCGESGQI